MTHRHAFAPETLDRSRALRWLKRWDDQQATFFVNREERFAVIVDVVGEVGRPDPLVVDLGVGPGSLAHRLLTRLPQATVVGVDMDPLLLGLAEAAYGDDSFRVVQADLSVPSWLDRLGLGRAPDAFVSSTALHWLHMTDLAAMIAEAVGSLASGGVFVDGDHFYEPQRTPRLDELRRVVAARAADRAGGRDAETWVQWWDAAQEAPELAGLVRRREDARLPSPHERHGSKAASLRDIQVALADAGCAEVGPVWENGDDYVVVGVR
ncbi:class I SAM-dependent methyltransferase [Flexivirga caeni]|uniref:Class I SAM-dependent methyltransferase n=1 Tax=Flexivirga caeni TaxID=2294115 RepID=A0A3M9M618_9MICO|nr:class I SAM-dependent methyltransferase [Flexivirga caeni]RNI20343.1 class I SAM-dependent methyltransferase [Flexivirga caeni]